MLARPQPDADEMYIYEYCAYTHIIHIYNIQSLYANMHFCKKNTSQHRNDLCTWMLARPQPDADEMYILYNVYI